VASDKVPPPAGANPTRAATPAASQQVPARFDPSDPGQNSWPGPRAGELPTFRGFAGRTLPGPAAAWSGPAGTGGGWDPTAAQTVAALSCSLPLWAAPTARLTKRPPWAPAPAFPCVAVGKRLFLSKQLRTPARAHIHTHVRARMRIHTHMRVTHTNTHTHAHTHIHTHTHTRAPDPPHLLGHSRQDGGHLRIRQRPDRHGTAPGRPPQGHDGRPGAVGRVKGQAESQRVMHYVGLCPEPVPPPAEPQLRQPLPHHLHHDRCDARACVCVCMCVCVYVCT
jgi:hypothetical protein